MSSVHSPMSESAQPLPPPDERRELLTLQEAAEMCAVDYETFRRWVIKGVLPHVQVGPTNIKRVYRRDVDQLIRPHGR